MATIEQAIVTRLKDADALYALVSNRVFAVEGPQDIKKPFIVFTLVSAPRAKNSQGPSYVAMSRYQFDCYATTTTACKNIAEKLRLALDGWRDLSADVAVKGCSLQGAREFLEPDTDPKLYRTSMDFIFTHDESQT
jgi:hypothetical protein